MAGTVARDGVYQIGVWDSQAQELLTTPGAILWDEGPVPDEVAERYPTSRVWRTGRLAAEFILRGKFGGYPAGCFVAYVTAVRSLRHRPVEVDTLLFDKAAA